jgi:hypothetical protein
VNYPRLSRASGLAGSSGVSRLAGAAGLAGWTWRAGVAAAAGMLINFYNILLIF